MSLRATTIGRNENPACTPGVGEVGGSGEGRSLTDIQGRSVVHERVEVDEAPDHGAPDDREQDHRVRPTGRWRQEEAGERHPESQRPRR